MPKIYTDEDNTFTGDNTFENGFDVSSNTIANLQTPSDSGDGANKSYVDGLFNSIQSGGVSVFSSNASSATDMVSIEVDVSSGQKVLLLANGLLPISSSSDDMTIWFRRDSTDLTNTSASMMDLPAIDDFYQPWFMFYLDTSPGTGTINYRIRGLTDGNTIYGRFTVLVFT